MSTLSVPNIDTKRQQIKKLIALGMYPNEAEFARQAITEKLEREAVNLILKAQQEPTLHGDLDTLSQQVI